MISLFPIAPNDQSIYYLNQIFGTVGTVLTNSSVAEGAPSQIIGSMFQVINTAVLVLGTLLVVYVTIVGVINTAHEGELFGKKFSPIWMPIRMVFGIVMMFPASGGYSILQILIMWFITQGIGAADKVWGAALTYSQTMGSPFSGTTATNSAGAAISLPLQMQALFEGLTCQATQHLSDANTITDSAGNTTKIYACASVGGNGPIDPSFCGSSNDDLQNLTGRATSDGSNYTYSMGPGGICGKMTYADSAAICASNPNTLNCFAAKALPQTLQTIVSTLGNIANTLAVADRQYITWMQTVQPANNMTQQPPDWINTYCQAKGVSSNECCLIKISRRGFLPIPFPCTGANLFFNWRSTAEGGGDRIDSASTKAAQNVYLPFVIQPYVGGNINFINAASNEWIANVIVNAQTQFLATLGPQVLTDWFKSAYETGWILAGRYFYNLAQLNQTTNTITINFNVIPPKPQDQNTYRNNIQTAYDLVNAMGLSYASGGGFASSTTGYAQLDDINSQLKHSMLTGLMDSLTNNANTNPLSKLAHYGQTLMIIAQVTFAVLLVVVPALMAVLTFNVFTMFGGITTTPWSEAFKAAINIISPFVVLLLSTIFMLGALLGFYIPFIPYIVFTMSAIGWMIGVIEAMAAGPFIALGILSPAGQHELLGRAEPAVMLLFNIFLRPTLMILGLIIAMLFAIVLVRFINAAFLATASSILMLDKAPGLFEQIVLVAIYVFLMISVFNKCFSLIHYLPEKVLTWIGGHEKAFGEGEALGEVKRGVEAVTGGAVSGARETGAAAKGAGAEMGKREARSQNQKKSPKVEGSGNQNQGGGGGGSGNS